MPNLTRFTFILFFLIAQLPAFAQAPNALWANRIGDGPGGLDRIVDLEKDANGNTYVLGWFRKSLDVDPGTGVSLITADGNGDDIWFAKYDSNNNLLWVNSLGTTSSENANALTLDAEGNIYITGYFVNTMDFDPSDSVFELTTFSASNSDAFFAKYSTDGDFIWAKQLGGPNPDNAQDIVLDNDGNILVTGNFSATADLDPSENEALFTTTGFNDIFLAKYTSNGDYIWAFSLQGSAVPDNGQCIAIHDDNSIVLGAIYQQDIDADPGPDELILDNANGYDVLIGTYTSQGDLIWAGSFGSNAVEQIYDLELDVNGNIYAVGSFSFTVDFDLGDGVNEISSAGNSDAFIASYTSSGDLRWVNTIGASSVDEANSVFVDEESNVIITGRFNGEVDFDPGPDSDILAGLSTDIFFASYTSEGDYNYARNIGGTGFDVGYAIYVQGETVTIGGLFALIADFDPSSGVAEEIGDNQTSFFAEYSISNGDFINVAAMDDRDGGDDHAYGIAFDNAGFSYVCGSFEGQPNFGETASGFNSNGDADGYLAKFSPSGNLVWAKQLGDTEPDVARALAISDDGFVYVVGEFEGEVQVGSGNETLVSSGNQDAFIIKYDLDGNYIWSIALGGGADEGAYAIDLDPEGNPFICGQFRGASNFDPLGAGFELTPNNRDIFIAGYDADDASLIWAKQINGPSNELGRTISIDSDGNVIAGGVFAGVIDADPGSNTVEVTSNGSNDGILVKLDASGNYIWHIQLGDNLSDEITSTTLDENNNLYICGHFNGSIDADMTTAETILTSNGGNDIMLLKYLDQIDQTDLVPVLDWAYNFGNAVDNFAFDLDIANNSIYFTGGSRDTINFDYTGNADPLVDFGVNFDIYVAQLTTSGDYESAFYIPGTRSNEYGYGIAVDNEDIFVVGSFDGTIDFQPGAQQNLLSPIGDLDGVIIKYGPSVPCENTSSTLSETACNSFELNETTYDASGTYTQTILNSAGCDSTITLNLTILEPSEFELTDSQCGVYTLNGIEYFESGVYTQELQNAAGCDSMITLNLTVFNPTESVINESSCNVFTLNGTEYDESGTYTQIIQNSVGCDSTITLVLDINPINPTVNQTGNLLTAEDEIAEYQWYDCINMVPLDGEVSQSFEVTSQGSFAVILNNGACIDTSECFLFETVDLNNFNLTENFKVYPNPGDGLFYVDIMNANEENLILSVLNIQGKILMNKIINMENNSINLRHLSKGVYFIQLQSGATITTQKLVIN